MPSGECARADSIELKAAPTRPWIFTEIFLINERYF